MELTAIGTSAFLPGFALAGVDTNIARNTNEVMAAAHAARPGSILIIEESTVRDATPQERAWLETSVDPVIITIGSDDGAQADRLRRAIKNTLGVDLLATKGAS